jgi:transmembrane 9 superfamily protein 2/4
VQDPETNEIYREVGFSLGTYEANTPKFHNHYEIKVFYHRSSPTEDDNQVVGVLVAGHR